jgi:peroxiredoxin
MLKVGTTAPDFVATQDDNSLFQLSDWTNRQNVILYFYVKDSTLG